MASLKFDKEIEIETILDSIGDLLDFKDELIKVSNEYVEKYDFFIDVKEDYDSKTQSEKDSIYRAELKDILHSFDIEDVEKYGNEVQERILKTQGFGDIS